MKSFLRIICTQLLACIAFGAFAQAPIGWNTAGTYQWVCPSGVTGVTVQLWGAGASSSANTSAGGGGAYVQTNTIPVTAGTTYQIIVGNGSYPFSSGTPNSSFGISGNSYVVANGGAYSSSGFSNSNGGGSSSGGYVSFSNTGGTGPAGFAGGSFAPSGGGAAASPCGAGSNGNWAGYPGYGGCGGGGGGDGQTNGHAPGGGAGCGYINYNGGDGAVILNLVQTTINYDTAGTYNWVCPVGVSSISMQMWGAGASPFALNHIVSSGGGGAFVQTGNIPVTPGQTYQIIVSAPGEGTYSGFVSGGSLLVYANSGHSAGGGGYMGISSGGFATPVSQYVNYSYAGGYGISECANESCSGGVVTAGGAGAGGPCKPGDNATFGSSTGAAGYCNGGNGGNWKQNGVFPGGGAGGTDGSNSPVGASGRVILSYQCDAGSTGSIGNGHTVAFPQELVPDKITSVVDPVIPAGVIIGWQQSTDNVNFVTAKTPDTLTTYRFDKDRLKTTTYYRRGNNSCVSGGGFGNWSNTVKILVFTSKNGRNGNITGKILSRNYTPINHRKIYAQSLTPLKGRPVGFLDSAYTDVNGNFSIDTIFYGNKDFPTNKGDSAVVRFKVYPDTSGGHYYNVSSYTVTLSALKPEYDLTSGGNNFPFLDNTVYAVTGKVYQVCSGCLDNSNTATTITGPEDSVFVYGLGKNNSVTQVERDSSKTSYSTSKGVYGIYNLLFQYSDSFTITPTYLHHGFKPDDSVINVMGDLSNINFNDTTTHVISGFFGAGCGDLIGTAVLEFDDSLHLGYDSLPQKSVFRKRVTTSSNGKFSIRLPARAYKVKVISVTVSDPYDASTSQSSIKSYFNALPADSIYRDISDHDTTLNLNYQRAPRIIVSGLKDDSIRTSNCSAFSNYDFWPQGVRRPVRVYVYQGPASRGCLIDTGVVTIRTDISQITGSFNYDTVPVVHGIATDSIVGAQPNTVKDPKTNTYSKKFTAKFFDIINRGFSTDTIKPALPIVLVTGAALDPSGTNFVTVSPQLPTLILHDPPGSTSHAEWEQEVSSSKTISFSTKTATSEGTYVKAKIGLDEMVGLFVYTRVAVDLGIDAELSSTQTFVNTNETEITTTSVEKLETSDDPAYIGTDADIVKGQALNIAYREGTEIDWDSAACKILDPKPVIVTDLAGVGTTYDYTIGSLRDEEIPRLERLAVATTNPDSARFYRDQEGIWQQLIDQNEENIKSAPVLDNKSFSNGTSYTTSTSLSNDQKNTYKFDLDIDTKVAVDVGFEFAGNGVTAGVSVGFAATIGGDSTVTSGTKTTTGYTLSDNNAGLPGAYSGDYLSVNIKRDPVYGTPMFETLAGGTQCPHEEGTVSLYHPLITAPVTELKGVTKDTASFIIYLNNLSNDPTPGGQRPYVLFLNASSNPAGATVLIGGTSSPDGVTYVIPNNGGQQPVTVNVIRNSGGGVFDYDNLELVMTDPCFTPVVQSFFGNPHESSSIKLSADFASPVSGISLDQPVNNWVENQSNHDSVKVVFSGYTLSALSNVSLQYNVPGTNIWNTIATFAKSQLGATSTTYYWKTSKRTDGNYNLRLQVTDNSARIIYSTVAAGLIDRITPRLFGVPQPSDGTYTAGTQISYSYTENLKSGITSGMIKLRDITTDQSVGIQTSLYRNTIMIVPTNGIVNRTGHLMRVIADSISDIHGNIKITPDTSYFTVGTTSYGTGPDALNITTTPTSMFEDSKSFFRVQFIRNTKATDSLVIYYNITGNAVLDEDYKVTYNSKGQSNLTGINGTQGKIILPKDSSKVEMYIYPKNDSIVTPNKILQFTLTPGGNYTLGSNYMISDTILNHNTIAPIITADKPLTLCSGDSLTLSTANKINGVSVKSYVWSTGATTQSTKVKTSGIYTVKVVNTNNFTGYSAPDTVTFSCAAPVNLKATVTSKSTAVLKWNVEGCAKKYIVKYRQVGTTTYTVDTVSTNVDSVKKLKAGTSYEWKVATLCQQTPTLITSTTISGTNFTTPASFDAIAVTNTDDYKRAAAGDGFSTLIYPNPASTFANVEVKGVRGKYSVVVTSMEGVALWKAENLTGDYVKIPISNFAQGYYMVTVKDELHTATLKLIKNR